MDREEIKKVSEKYFKAMGYKKEEKGENAYYLSRTKGVGIGKDEVLIYFHKKGDRIDDKYLSSLRKNYPEADRFFITDIPLVPVPKKVTSNKFIYQVPVHFFDREFRTDTITPLIELAKELQKYEQERIPQPFTSETSEGTDLLETLLNELNKYDAPCIRFVVAPAGYGKTVLMNILYKKLFERFKERKKKQEIYMRPLIMLPGHLRGARVESMDELIQSFINKEYLYGTTNEEIFKLLINNNFAIWLLDGLEELILRNPDEFLFKIVDEYVVSAEAKNPQIIISIRAPLLTTCPEIQEFIEDWKEVIKVYELSKWGDVQKTQYFRKNLKPSSYLPKNEINNFIQDLKDSQSLNNLCDIPYYCSLVSDLKNRGEMRIINNEIELVGYSFEKICDREYAKGLDKDICAIKVQKELFSELAAEKWEKREISIGTLIEYIELSLPDNLVPDIRGEQLACLKRHAILSSIQDKIGFTHDIMEQYLISLALHRRFLNGQYKLFDVSEIDYYSFIMKYLTKNLGSVDWGRIIDSALSSLSSSTNDKAFGFRNILKLCLAIFREINAIKSWLQGRNLSRLRFQNLNLSGFSFEGSNLTLTEFRNCTLKGVKFDRCDLKDTFFDKHSDLTNASYRGIIAERIRVGTKIIDYEKGIKEFFYKKSMAPVEQTGPCQAVINLRKIFGKTIKRGKGMRVPKKFLLHTKCTGGIPAEACVGVSVRRKYLSKDGDYLKINFMLFEEVKNFVEDMKVSDGIRQILNEICPDVGTGCLHT